MARRRDPDEFIDSFSAVRKCISAEAAKAYAAEELGTMQAKLLRTIGEHGRVSQAALARATDSDPTLTGRALQTLIARGLVRRERSAEDKRVYVVDLSARGRRARDRVEALRTAVATRIVAALDARDLDDFARIARKIRAALEPADGD